MRSTVGALVTLWLVASAFGCSTQLGATVGFHNSWHPFEDAGAFDAAIPAGVTAHGEVTEVDADKGLTRGRFGPYEVTVEHEPGSTSMRITCRASGTWTPPRETRGGFSLGGGGLTFQNKAITAQRCAEIIGDEISKRL